MKFKEKVVIITGAGQGIGRAYAHAFAKEGAKVVIAEINETNGQAVAKEITKEGFEAVGIRTDVSDAESVDGMVKAVVEKYGRIDVLVNNAALFATVKMKPFWEISVGEWDKVMAVNLRGMFLCCKAVAPIMKAQKQGKIINISSGTALMGRPYYLHYVTSKAGVIGFTRALARELGDWNINVNSVSPGSVETEVPRESVTPEQAKALIAQQCIKKREVPQDLVGIVMFLASDEANFITGQLFNVDGGLNMY